MNPRNGYQHTHTIILLHGRGSECQDFAGELFESESSGPADKVRTLPDLCPTVRWVFPGAPILPSHRFHEAMSQWFDIWSVENPEEQAELQHDGITQSVAMIRDVINKEEALVPASKIFLGGISQGFATAVAAFFARGQGLAGLLGFCSWMPLATRVLDVARSDQPADEILQLVQKVYIKDARTDFSPEQIRSTPVFLGHATDDEVVPIHTGEKTSGLLDFITRLSRMA